MIDCICHSPYNTATSALRGKKQATVHIFAKPVFVNVRQQTTGDGHRCADELRVGGGVWSSYDWRRRRRRRRQSTETALTLEMCVS